MTSTVKVDNVQKVSDASNIIKKCGTTITLGASGDTINLASGASQTGFGRTGTVNWDTASIKTTGFTAVSGNGYFCNTAASGAFTLTLPTSPSAGDIVGLKDYNGNFATANLTIGRGGSKINGADAADVTIDTAGASIFLVYVDATQGWVATQDDSSTFAGESFMTASISGACNTLTTCGNDKIAKFLNPGTFTVCSVGSTAADNIVSYMVVAGGGGSAGDRGGGGGAGGFRELVSPSSPYSGSPLNGYPTPGNRITVTATGYAITVGGGGASDNSPPYTDGTQGTPSIFSTITAAGGGAGHRNTSPGGDGGSGGGAGSVSPHTPQPGGSGNTPPTTPAQGQDGGDSGNSPPFYTTGGGGGAGAAGGNGAPADGGTGGAGVTTSISGTPTAYAGGGGGGSDNGGGGAGAGGTGGGGTGGSGPSGGNTVATSGGCNTGGGAGGSSGGGPGVQAGVGGSGIVIIRYKFQ